MKSKLTNKILEILGDSLLTTADLIVAILESGYGASTHKLEKNFNRIQSDRIRREISYQERQRFSNILSKLKREGLVESKERKWKITKNGSDKVKRLRENIFQKGNYPIEKDEVLKLIIFDIPERDKGKRVWLRESLRELGFEILQKSVWVGKVKIPAEFLSDLRRLGILEFVHIFSVQNSGTLSIKK